MGNLLIFLIKIYQKIPLKTHTACRFYPTCSEYAILSIKKYGTVKSLPKIVKRIVSCHPFKEHTIDIP